MGEPGAGRMFKIVDAGTGDAMGSVGYWEKDWRRRDRLRDRLVGPPRVPGTRRRGRGGRALVIEGRARDERRHRYLHAFPSVENCAVERHLPQARVRAPG